MSSQKSKKKQKNTFRVGALHRTGRHGDHGTHFRANGEAVGRLVNVQPAKRPRLGVNDALGSWTPFTEEGWAQSASLADEVMVEIPPIRKWYLSSDNPMAVWRKHKAKFLDELLRAEGLGGGFHIPTCAQCGQEAIRFFKCPHCGQFLQCEDCLKRRHEQLPLHRPQMWNGLFWTTCSLYDDPNADVRLGMCYQLGHYGFPCAAPEPMVRTLVILDVGGITKLDCRFCGCSESLRHRHGHISQLLDNAWYPATISSPSTCATFELLDMFRLLKVVGNVTAHDLLRSLERLSNATLTRKMPDRYKSFLRMSRQYDYLIRAKRAGRGHCPNGLQTTGAGGLAVQCWACPDPECNLPEGWQEAPQSDSFLYALMLTIDTNFRLKNRIQSNERDDPSLCAGQGYFVLNEPYKHHLRNYVAEEDTSTCIAFQALMQKETKLTTGLRVSGVGDYANMDWVVLSALRWTTVRRLVLSYDIACQWKQRLKLRAKVLVKGEEERVKEWAIDHGWSSSSEQGPVPLAGSKAIGTDLDNYDIQFALPVWHAAAHETSCQAANSLSHAVGVGRTDGEGIERTWALLNPIGYLTKEMGEGSRHDVIEEKVDYLNFEKNVKEGDTLARKMIIAMAERDRQREQFKEVDVSLTPAMRTDWQGRLDRWNADPSAPNPYVLDGNQGRSEAQILADLKRAELEDLRGGTWRICSGRRITAEVKEATNLTAERSSQIDEQRASFYKKLHSWETHQRVFMPGVGALRLKEEEKRNPEAPPPLAEEIKLWLPSDLTAEERRLACRTGLAETESKLRQGQCADALDNLRGHLQSKMHIIDYRNANAVGQRASTRSNTVITRINGHVKRETIKYRTAYEAGQRLEEGFAPEFQTLKDEDIRVMGEVESDAAARAALGRAGTNRRLRNEPAIPERPIPVSWIWRGSGPQGLHDSLRVQWTKAEEMRRVLQSLNAIQEEWRGRVDGRPEVDVALDEGLKAYARRQATVYGRISAKFQARWSASAAEGVRTVLDEGREHDAEEEADWEDVGADVTGAR
ncbi:CxC2 domain-containing protein [Mycena indigotica]|uniref:CxC2 domain-containing protein n=1 Tax=Mycena indigotica TaxID=2126181 RepID=A0A8H6SUP1_9AGAR|nr:CxC2 domain-containing protein [Mycena indigotica]KAF7306223.1 CxC2 domain-containing protein [Mycena indigotica]